MKGIWKLVVALLAGIAILALIAFLSDKIPGGDMIRRVAAVLGLPIIFGVLVLVLVGMSMGRSNATVPAAGWRTGTMKIGARILNAGGLLLLLAVTSAAAFEYRDGLAVAAGLGTLALVTPEVLRTWHVRWNDTSLVAVGWTLRQVKHDWRDLEEMNGHGQSRKSNPTKLRFRGSGTVWISVQNDAYGEVMDYAKERFAQNVARRIQDAGARPILREGTISVFDLARVVLSLLTLSMSALMLWLAYDQEPLTGGNFIQILFIIVPIAILLALFGLNSLPPRISWDQAGVRRSLALFRVRRYDWRALEAIRIKDGEILLAFANGANVPLSAAWRGVDDLIAYARSRLNA